MSTIGSLLALASDPGIKPWDEIVKSSTQAQTGLRELADFKRKQASEALLMEAIKNDPTLRERLFGGSVLGSLGQAPGPGGPPAAGAGPITQSPLGGGPSQQIPAYPDASRFAGVSPQGGGPIPPNVMQQAMPTVTPPQGQPGGSVLASLGGQPQGPGAMQGPQNPLLEMARRDPRAAMMLQQQLQAQQTQQWAIEEKRLDMGVKIAEGVAQELSVVKDQASLDAARERIRQYHPQAAAQIPQFYSKEALEPLIMKGVAVKDLALWRKNMASAKNTEMMTEQLPATFRALEGFATGGGGQAPADGGGTQAPATGTQARTAPPEFESAITDANRLYPQVSTTRIKSIIAAESNFDAKAVSSAGAKGPMQLMDGTAKEMGVDDPFNVQQSVRGGTRYYAQMLAKYGGDERKALAAYNWGPGNLDKVGGDVSKAPPETQAYVNRVIGGGGAAAGGTTGTTQAPPTDPRVAQLRARIEQGNKAARQAELSGMEGPARQVRAEVNDLQRELDNLEAPRRRFESERAVQGLEIERKEREGLARAQLEADTKPASNTEIDAINRGLPQDKQLSYGTTYKEIREKKLVGAAQVAPKVVDDLTATTMAIQNFEELSNAVTALPTGPLTQYVEGFKERWGIDISNEKVAQRAILQGATNQLLQARSGAAISEGEYQRLLKELPNEGLDPKVFKARLANTVRQFKNLYKTKVQILRKTGHAIPDDLMEPLAAPEAPPAPKVSTAVDNFRNAVRPK